MAQKQSVYLSDHSDSVLESHNLRTAANSAAYLLFFLQPHMRILDVGCGPGSITTSLADMVPDGHVIGIDKGADVTEKARATAAERGVQNVSFQVGDAHALDFPDHAFDAVHAHHVLQHIGDPIHALREWRRVTKPGGLIACREGDSSSTACYPELEAMTEFQNLYKRLARARGGEPDGGRHLIAWARAAGFERNHITATASVSCYSTRKERAYWSNMWVDHLFQTALYKHLVGGGHATEKDLDRYAGALRDWGANEDGWLWVFSVVFSCYCANIAWNFTTSLTYPGFFTR